MKRPRERSKLHSGAMPAHKLRTTTDSTPLRETIAVSTYGGGETTTVSPEGLLASTVSTALPEGLAKPPLTLSEECAWFLALLEELA
jgi:hypothetical protein